MPERRATCPIEKTSIAVAPSRKLYTLSHTTESRESDSSRCIQFLHYCSTPDHFKPPRGCSPLLSIPILGNVLKWLSCFSHPGSADSRGRSLVVRAWEA